MTKRQHYVPQSNLKLFTRDEKNIFVLDKSDHSIRLQSVKDTAVISHFYRDERHPAPLEIKEITELENRAFLIIKKIECEEELTSLDLGHLCNFVSLQFLRVPKSKKRIGDLYKLFLNELRKKYVKGVLKDSKIIEIATAELLKEEPGSMKVRDFLYSEQEFTIPETLFMDMLSVQGMSIAENFSKQKWIFHFTQGEDEWISCDNPVASSDAFDGKSHPVLNGSTVKFFPMSKKVMLSISKEGFSVERKNMFSWAVRDLNLMTALNATRYVFSGNEGLLKKVSTMVIEYNKDPNAYREYLTSTRSQ